MNKVLKSGMALAMLVTAMPASALAANLPSAPTQTTPVNATVAVTPINVTVSDNITLTANSDSVTAQYTNLVLTNQSAVGVIKITNMAVNAAGGWNKAVDSTEFDKLPMNAKKFSMVHAGKDLNTAQALTYRVIPGQKQTMAFTGKTGAVTTEVKGEKVADVVLTVGYDVASPAA